MINGAGKQLHLLLPPRVANNALLKHPNCSECLRHDLGWQTVFVPRNTVPLDQHGRVLPGGYSRKLALMMRGMDARGDADAAIADLHFERWM